MVRRTVELAEIPAPTGLEAARQERVRTWWAEDGWADVRADQVGNLWARVRPGEGPGAEITVALEELGRRPAGELAQTHPLARAAAGALRAAGLPAVFTAASTDANAAHAARVPALAIGVTTGGGEHTPGEWIDTSQLGTGLRCAAATITGWERGALEGGGA